MGDNDKKVANTNNEAHPLEPGINATLVYIDKDNNEDKESDDK